MLAVKIPSPTSLPPFPPLNLVTQAYLRTMSAPGLVLLEVDGDDDGGDDNDSGLNEKPQPPPLVREFNDLIPGAFYALAPIDMKEQMSKLLGEARHLQQAREDEFGRALCAELRNAFPSEVRGLGPLPVYIDWHWLAHVNLGFIFLRPAGAPSLCTPIPTYSSGFAPSSLEYPTGISTTR